MRLINVHNLSLEEFFDNDTPYYAILSHTWRDGEVTFQDWQDLRRARTKKGFAKIIAACAKTRELYADIDWLWVDTNCIDKTSSAELSEAINSMFRWYERSEICFVHLDDFILDDAASTARHRNKFEACRWFSRGWTLQELIAPFKIRFYSSTWTEIGSKQDDWLVRILHEITGIGLSVLRKPRASSLRNQSVATKFSWLARRRTTRVEDMAYCALGLFDINMPLLYGEGNKAFTRLQEEIIKDSNDHSIFCWAWDSSVPDDWVSMLAPNPRVYAQSGGYQPLQQMGPKPSLLLSTYAMTNGGLSISLEILNLAGGQSPFLVKLDVVDTSAAVPHDSVFVLVEGEKHGDTILARRRPLFPAPIAAIWSDFIAKPQKASLLNQKRPDGVSDSERGWWAELKKQRFLHRLRERRGIRRGASDEIAFGLTISYFASSGWRVMPDSTLNPPWCLCAGLTSATAPGEQHGTVRVAATFTSIRPYVTGTVERSTTFDPHIFLAARLTEADDGTKRDLFCQVFSRTPGGADGLDALSAEETDERLAQLKGQVLGMSRCQLSHYNENAAMSVIIGPDLVPSEILMPVRVLPLDPDEKNFVACRSVVGVHISFGRQGISCLAVTEEYTDCEKRCSDAEVGLKHPIPSTGTFHLEGWT